MKINPKVTAVIRTYNRAELLPQAVESVLNQTFHDFELLIIDDCSTDNTEKVVKNYIKRDTRVRYSRHEVNSRHGRAANTAHSAAKGMYIAYLDDDDTWCPDKLEKQVNKFEKCSEKVGMIIGGVQYWNSDTGKKLHQWIPNKRGDIYIESLGTSGNIFGPPSVVMIRKCVIDDIGDMREDMPRGCCQQYFRRVAKKYLIDYVDDVVLDYYYHNEAITSINNKEDIHNCIVSLKIKINSTLDDLKQVPDIYAEELVKLGNYQCQYGAFIDGVKSLIKSLGYSFSFKKVLSFIPMIIKDIKIFFFTRK
jgi:glycosyltransferase involved in cell wall biosynthesis